MTEYVITLLAAAAVTYILTPLVRRFAIAVGAMHAARERDVHELPTPLLGGFAIYGGLVFALLLASRLSGLNSVFTETNLAKGLLLAGGLVVIMGFVDDRWGMGALSKLAGQVAAGVILVWSGAEIPWLPEPGGVTLILTSDQQVAVTILVVVVTMNAVNFIDGLDGLAAGIVGIGAIAFFAYYFTLVHRLGLLDQSEPALVSVLLAGVCLGFLPHNFYPARIFMGDTGSMLIGLMLAYAPISSLALLDPLALTDTRAYAAGTVNRYAAFIPLLVPAAILLIPYADLLMAVVRRTRAGKSVFAPDKKHLQHRLLAIGHSHRTSVLIMYLWAALFSGSVIWLSIVRTPLIVLVIVTVGAVLGLLLVTMPRLRPWSRATAGDAAVGGPVPRHAGAAPAGVAPASAGPAAAAGTGAVPAGPAAAGPGPVRPAGAGAVQAPGAAGGSAGGSAATQRASRRRASQPAAPEKVAARRAGTSPAGKTGSPGEGGWPSAAGSGPSDGPAANGADGVPGKGRAGNGNGAGGNGAASAKGRGRPAKDRGRKGSAAGSDAPAAPEDEAGSPVTRAAGPGGWSSESAGTLPPGSGDRSVPPWDGHDAEPFPASARPAALRDGGWAVPPWEAESSVASPEPASSAPSWDAGRTAPPAGAGSPPSQAAGRSVPPWELPPETHSAVPPWAAGHAVPPWAAGRSVPPWELAGPAGADATGAIPAQPWPGPGGSPAEASDGPGNGHPAPPWPPAAPPQRPAAPPLPPASPPWP
jgi:UDP-GlcNAc:undecaprenyl-phosphate GlcNAc-1-phosphate transferase